MSEWWIHLKSTGNCNASHRFRGTREAAEQDAKAHMGKVASWNCRKEPHQPNLWDFYNAWELEEIVTLAHGGVVKETP